MIRRGRPRLACKTSCVSLPFLSLSLSSTGTSATQRWKGVAARSQHGTHALARGWHCQWQHAHAACSERVAGHHRRAPACAPPAWSSAPCGLHTCMHAATQLASQSSRCLRTHRCCGQPAKPNALQRLADRNHLKPAPAGWLLRARPRGQRRATHACSAHLVDLLLFGALGCALPCGWARGAQLQHQPLAQLVQHVVRALLRHRLIDHHHHHQAIK